MDVIQTIQQDAATSLSRTPRRHGPPSRRTARKALAWVDKNIPSATDRNRHVGDGRGGLT